MDEHLKELKEKLAADSATLVDVREEAEWEDGHIAGARFVPLSELKAGAVPKLADKKRNYYLYCRSGNRVQLAQSILESMGYENIIALDEGFDELCAEDFPATDPE